MTLRKLNSKQAGVVTSYLKSPDTFSDLRFGQGDVYQKIGMEFVKRTAPGYFYYHNKTSRETYSRFLFQRNTIEKRCATIPYDSTKTEFENAEQNGYRIYYDCGNNQYAIRHK